MFFKKDGAGFWTIFPHFDKNIENCTKKIYIHTRIYIYKLVYVCRERELYTSKYSIYLSGKKEKQRFFCCFFLMQFSIFLFFFVNAENFILEISSRLP